MSRRDGEGTTGPGTAAAAAAAAGAIDPDEHLFSSPDSPLAAAAAATNPGGAVRPPPPPSSESVNSSSLRRGGPRRGPGPGGPSRREGGGGGGGGGRGGGGGGGGCGGPGKKSGGSSPPSSPRRQRQQQPSREGSGGVSGSGSGTGVAKPGAAAGGGAAGGGVGPTDPPRSSPTPTPPPQQQQQQPPQGQGQGQQRRRHTGGGGVSSPIPLDKSYSSLSFRHGLREGKGGSSRSLGKGGGGSVGRGGGGGGGVGGGGGGGSPRPKSKKALPPSSNFDADDGDAPPSPDAGAGAAEAAAVGGSERLCRLGSVLSCDGRPTLSTDVKIRAARCLRLTLEQLPPPDIGHDGHGDVEVDDPRGGDECGGAAASSSSSSSPPPTPPLLHSHTPMDAYFYLPAVTTVAAPPPACEGNSQEQGSAIGGGEEGERSDDANPSKSPTGAQSPAGKGSGGGGDDDGGRRSEGATSASASASASAAAAPQPPPPPRVVGSGVRLPVLRDFNKTFKRGYTILMWVRPFVHLGGGGGNDGGGDAASASTSMDAAASASAAAVLAGEPQVLFRLSTRDSRAFVQCTLSKWTHDEDNPGRSSAKLVLSTGGGPGTGTSVGGRTEGGALGGSKSTGSLLEATRRSLSDHNQHHPHLQHSHSSSIPHQQQQQQHGKDGHHAAQQHNHHHRHHQQQQQHHGKARPRNLHHVAASTLSLSRSGEWHLLSVSHSNPYLKRPKLTLCLDGDVVLEAECPFPQVYDPHDPKYSPAGGGGGNGASAFYHDPSMSLNRPSSGGGKANGGPAGGGIGSLDMDDNVLLHHMSAPFLVGPLGVLLDPVPQPVLAVLAEHGPPGGGTLLPHVCPTPVNRDAAPTPVQDGVSVGLSDLHGDGGAGGGGGPASGGGGEGYHHHPGVVPVGVRGTMWKNQNGIGAGRLGCRVNREGTKNRPAELIQILRNKILYEYHPADVAATPENDLLSGGGGGVSSGSLGGGGGRDEQARTAAHHGRRRRVVCPPGRRSKALGNTEGVRLGLVEPNPAPSSSSSHSGGGSGGGDSSSPLSGGSMVLTGRGRLVTNSTLWRCSSPASPSPSSPRCSEMAAVVPRSWMYPSPSPGGGPPRPLVGTHVAVHTLSLCLLPLRLALPLPGTEYRVSSSRRRAAAKGAGRGVTKTTATTTTVGAEERVDVNNNKLAVRLARAQRRHLRALFLAHHRQRVTVEGGGGGGTCLLAEILHVVACLLRSSGELREDAVQSGYVYVLGSLLRRVLRRWHRFRRHLSLAEGIDDDDKDEVAYDVAGKKSGRQHRRKKVQDEDDGGGGSKEDDGDVLEKLLRSGEGLDLVGVGDDDEDDDVEENERELLRYMTEPEETVLFSPFSASSSATPIPHTVPLQYNPLSPAAEAAGAMFGVPTAAGRGGGCAATPEGSLYNVPIPQDVARGAVDVVSACCGGLLSTGHEGLPQPIRRQKDGTTESSNDQRNDRVASKDTGGDTHPSPTTPTKRPSLNTSSPQPPPRHFHRTTTVASLRLRRTADLALQCLHGFALDFTLWGTNPLPPGRRKNGGDDHRPGPGGVSGHDVTPVNNSTNWEAASLMLNAVASRYCNLTLPPTDSGVVVGHSALGGGDDGDHYYGPVLRNHMSVQCLLDKIRWHFNLAPGTEISLDAEDRRHLARSVTALSALLSTLLRTSLSDMSECGVSRSERDVAACVAVLAEHPLGTVATAVVLRGLHDLLMECTVNTVGVWYVFPPEEVELTGRKRSKQRRRSGRDGENEAEAGGSGCSSGGDAASSPPSSSYVQQRYFGTTSGGAAGTGAGAASSPRSRQHRLETIATRLSRNLRVSEYHTVVGPMLLSRMISRGKNNNNNTTATGLTGAMGAAHVGSMDGNAAAAASFPRDISPPGTTNVDHDGSLRHRKSDGDCKDAQHRATKNNLRQKLDDVDGGRDAHDGEDDEEQQPNESGCLCLDWRRDWRRALLLFVWLNTSTARNTSNRLLFDTAEGDTISSSPSRSSSSSDLVARNAGNLFLASAKTGALSKCVDSHLIHRLIPPHPNFAKKPSITAGSPYRSAGSSPLAINRLRVTLPLVPALVAGLIFCSAPSGGGEEDCGKTNCAVARAVEVTRRRSSSGIMTSINSSDLSCLYQLIMALDYSIQSLLGGTDKSSFGMGIASSAFDFPTTTSSLTSYQPYYSSKAAATTGSGGGGISSSPAQQNMATKKICAFGEWIIPILLKVVVLLRRYDTEDDGDDLDSWCVSSEHLVPSHQQHRARKIGTNKAHTLPKSHSLASAYSSDTTDDQWVNLCGNLDDPSYKVAAAAEPSKKPSAHAFAPAPASLPSSSSTLSTCRRVMLNTVGCVIAALMQRGGEASIVAWKTVVDSLPSSSPPSPPRCGVVRREQHGEGGGVDRAPVPSESNEATDRGSEQSRLHKDKSGGNKDDGVAVEDLAASSSHETMNDKAQTAENKLHSVPSSGTKSDQNARSANTDGKGSSSTPTSPPPPRDVENRDVLCTLAAVVLSKISHLGEETSSCASNGGDTKPWSDEFCSGIVRLANLVEEKRLLYVASSCFSSCATTGGDKANDAGCDGKDKVVPPSSYHLDAHQVLLVRCICSVLRVGREHMGWCQLTLAGSAAVFPAAAPPPSSSSVASPTNNMIPDDYGTSRHNFNAVATANRAPGTVEASNAQADYGGGGSNGASGADPNSSSTSHSDLNTGESTIAVAPSGGEDSPQRQESPQHHQLSQFVNEALLLPAEPVPTSGASQRDVDAGRPPSKPLMGGTEHAPSYLPLLQPFLRVVLQSVGSLPPRPRLQARDDGCESHDGDETTTYDIWDVCFQELKATLTAAIVGLSFPVARDVGIMAMAALRRAMSDTCKLRTSMNDVDNVLSSSALPDNELLSTGSALALCDEYCTELMLNVVDELRARHLRERQLRDRRKKGDRTSAHSSSSKGNKPHHELHSMESQRVDTNHQDHAFIEQMIMGQSPFPRHVSNGENDSVPAVSVCLSGDASSPASQKSPRTTKSEDVVTTNENQTSVVSTGASLKSIDLEENAAAPGTSKINKSGKQASDENVARSALDFEDDFIFYTDALKFETTNLSKVNQIIESSGVSMLHWTNYAGFNNSLEQCHAIIEGSNDSLHKAEQEEDAEQKPRGRLWSPDVGESTGDCSQQQDDVGSEIGPCGAPSERSSPSSRKGSGDQAKTNKLLSEEREHKQRSLVASIPPVLGILNPYLDIWDESMRRDETAENDGYDMVEVFDSAYSAASPSTSSPHRPGAASCSNVPLDNGRDLSNQSATDRRNSINLDNYNADVVAQFIELATAERSRMVDTRQTMVPLIVSSCDGAAEEFCMRHQYNLLHVSVIAEGRYRVMERCIQDGGRDVYSRIVTCPTPSKFRRFIPDYLDHSGEADPTISSKGHEPLPDKDVISPKGESEEALDIGSNEEQRILSPGSNLQREGSIGQLLLPHPEASGLEPRLNVISEDVTSEDLKKIALNVKIVDITKQHTSEQLSIVESVSADEMKGDGNESDSEGSLGFPERSSPILPNDIQGDDSEVPSLEPERSGEGYDNDQQPRESSSIGRSEVSQQEHSQSHAVSEQHLSVSTTTASLSCNMTTFAIPPSNNLSTSLGSGAAAEVVDSYWDNVLHVRPEGSRRGALLLTPTHIILEYHYADDHGLYEGEVLALEESYKRQLDNSSEVITAKKVEGQVELAHTSKMGSLGANSRNQQTLTFQNGQQWHEEDLTGGEGNDSHDAYIDERDDATSVVRNHMQSTMAAAALRPKLLRWALAEMSQIFLRRYRLRDSAMELFLVPSGGTEGGGGVQQPSISIFLDFGPGRIGNTKRDEAANAIMKRSPHQCIKQWPDRSNAFLHEQRNRLTTAWMEHRLSNMDYLLQLNTLAGRTFNDLCQYPVMPWVLSDYTSSTVPDLLDESNFRDLTKPIGALNPDRLEDFLERFDTFVDPTIPPFMYGSHYSTSAGVVLHFLVRLHPFGGLHRQLQGGHFDVADRLFCSVPRTWEMCTGSSAAEVKELTPEWYCNPSFLRNSNKFKLGTSQEGELLGDVELPPWADGSAEKFIEVMRSALESDIASQMLPDWIDLIFGCKQQGPEAVEAHNVFFYLTYYGSVDVASIEDEALRTATELQIAHFGQCPMQMFGRPHPQKRRDIPMTDFSTMLGLYKMSGIFAEQKGNIDTVMSDEQQHEVKLPFMSAPLSHWVHLHAPPPGPHASLMSVRLAGTDRCLAVDAHGIFHSFRWAWKPEETSDFFNEQDNDISSDSEADPDKTEIDNRAVPRDSGCFIAQRELPHFRSIPRLPYRSNDPNMPVVVALSKTLFASHSLLLALSDGNGKGALALQFVDVAKGVVRGETIIPAVHSSRITTIAMDPIGVATGGGAGGELAVVGSADGSATLWRFISSHYLPLRPKQRMRGHGGKPILSVAICGTMNVCATISACRCCIFNLGNGAMLCSFPPPEDAFRGLSLDTFRAEQRTTFANTRASCISIQGFIILVCKTHLTQRNDDSRFRSSPDTKRIKEIITLQLFSLEGVHCGSIALESWRGVPHKIASTVDGKAVMVCRSRGVSIHRVSPTYPLEFVDEWSIADDGSDDAAYDADFGPSLSRPVVAAAACSGGALRLHALPGISAWSEAHRKGSVSAAVGNALAKPAQKLKSAVGSVKGIGNRVVGFGKELGREAMSDVKERGVTGFLGGMFGKGTGNR